MCGRVNNVVAALRQERMTYLQVGQFERPIFLFFLVLFFFRCCFFFLYLFFFHFDFIALIFFYMYPCSRAGDISDVAVRFVDDVDISRKYFCLFCCCRHIKSDYEHDIPRAPWRSFATTSPAPPPHACCCSTRRIVCEQPHP